MFKITDAEKLRDAYTLLAFIRDTTTAEQKSGMAAFIASIKKEIRDYNNRPAPDSRIIEERGIDGYIELVKLPNELDDLNEDDAPSGSGQIATTSFTRRPMTAPGSASQTGTSCTAAAGTGSHIIRSALTFNQKGGQNHENGKRKGRGRLLQSYHEEREGTICGEGSEWPAHHGSGSAEA